MNSAPIIAADNVGFRASGRWLLKNVSFSLTQGITAVIGPNGAGKSTLMRIMAGLLPLHRGRLNLAEENGGKARVGYIPQFPGAYDHLTPKEFLIRTAWWDAKGELARIAARADEVLRRFGLEPVKDNPGRTLHISERRRVALASLWMRNVRIVLLDEPTAGLDPEERLAFWQELYQVRRLEGAPDAYLVTTHLLSEVALYCDELIFLDRGRVRHQASIPQFTATALGHSFFAPEVTRSLPTIDTGRLSGEGHWVVAPRSLQGLSPREPDLVDAYLWALHRQRFEGAIT